MSTSFKRLFSSVLFLVLTLALTLPTSAAAPAQDGSSGLALPDGPVSAKIDSSLADATGPVEIVVRLTSASLAEAQGQGAKQKGGKLNKGQQRDYLRKLQQEQDALVSQARGLGARELGRMSKALNAVAVKIDASKIQALASLPTVRSVRPVVTYEIDLSETVPYIGATAVQAAGYDGTGVKVAVLDSGIDYTHFNLGGAGTAAAYEAAYGTTATPRYTTRDGLFPTAKVYDGFDFVGETWPNGDRTEDPDPIDLEGHGTHVADIIAGRSADGTHKGVAPGAQLLAVKVCSAVASSCNGVALLKGVDYALDPNGDGDISDAVDVMNLSLGSSYGQREDDLSAATANAVNLGVVVVASAGNSADRPYILGSPSSTPEVISVAQTQVPSAETFPLVINSPSNIAGVYPNTATLDWAPVGSGFTGNVAYVGQGCNADTYLANPAGKVALVDRGACNVSEKVDRAARAGAIGVLVGLIAPGDAVSFSLGNGSQFVPSIVIIQSYATLIKNSLAAGNTVNVSVSPAVVTPLVGSMVGSSSRGPSVSYNEIKPDIGAPGASISAVAGGGTAEEAFGGTSGAAPMVSGSAALLIDAYPTRGPAEIKALLMNTAETNIQTNPATQPGVLAPITRIGGGEVRVNKALNSKTAAWDSEALTGSLSFGYRTLSENKSIKKTVLVRNYGSQPQTYTITPTFRYANDQASGAVTIKAPKTISVPANSSKTFDVQLKIDASKLPTWGLNGGSLGGDGSLLQSVEFDGYLNLTSSTDNIHLAWQVLPHKAADITLSTTSAPLNGGTLDVTLNNTAGAVDGRVDIFSMTGTSKRIAKRNLPQPGDNFAIIDLKAVGVRQAGSAIQFGITTWGERAHPNYPAEFDVYIDTNRDGTFDYIVYNGELSGFAVTGQNVVFVQQIGAATATAYFYTDADLNSANVILTAPLAALGLTPSSKFTFSVFAFDNYFTGSLTDSIENMTYTVGTPRFTATALPASGVEAGDTATITISAVPGGEAASPSQIGLLLLYRDGKIGREADLITVTP
jgi:hypothetical protein